MAKQKFNFQPIDKNPSSRSPGDPEGNISNVATVSNSVASSIEQLSTTKQKSSFNFKFIPRGRIRINKRNKYPISDMESLKESILHFGLLHNLVVIYSMEEDIYILEAGQRRTQALDELISEYKDFESRRSPGDPQDEKYELYIKNVQEYEKGYPCKITSNLKEDIQYDLTDDTDENEEVIDSEIRLIISNEEVRSTIPAIKAENIKRLNELYSMKNKHAKNKTDKININKQIATDLKISESQVKNYKTIDKLIPELKAEFDKNNISLKAGAGYARLSEEEQYVILNMIRAGQNVSPVEVKVLIDERNYLLQDIAQKEEKIAHLESQNTNSAPDDDNKDQEIKALKKEIKELRKKPIVTASASLTPEQSAIIKADLAVRSCFEQNKHCLNELVNAINNFETLLIE